MCKVAGIRGYEYSGLAFAVMKIRLARSYDDDGGHDGVLVEIVHGNRSMTIVHRREVLGATRFPPTCPALGGRKLGGRGNWKAWKLRCVCSIDRIFAPLMEEHHRGMRLFPKRFLLISHDRAVIENISAAREVINERML